MLPINKWLFGILTAAILLGSAYFFGYKSGLGNVVTQTVEVGGETHTVYKDKIITVTKVIKPDGTVEETTKTEEKQGKTDSSSSDKKVAVTPRSNKYSLGLFAVPKIEHEGFQVKSVKLLPGVTAGYNLGKDIWLKAGWVPAVSIVMVGVEIQF